MKVIVIPKHPKEVADILNGNKTLDFHTNVPKCDLPIDVYIYCTRLQRKHGVWNACLKHAFDGVWRVGNFLGSNENEPVNGKVVAKFTLRQRGFRRLRMYGFGCYSDKTLKEITEASRMTADQLCILGKNSNEIYGWPISDLVIFDKPKTLSEFGLGMAPISWRYVEVKE